MTQAEIVGSTVAKLCMVMTMPIELAVEIEQVLSK